jgi:hypothetical protein
MPRLDYGAREESTTVQVWRTDRAGFLFAGLFMARVTIRRTYSYREASRWPNYIARASRGTKSGESSGGLAGSTDGYSSTTAIRVRPTPNKSPTVLRAVDPWSARISERLRGHNTRRPGRGILKSARLLEAGFQHATPFGLRLSAFQLFLDAPRDQAFLGNAVGTPIQAPRFR